MAAAGNPEHRCAARGVGFAPTDEGQKIPFGSFGHTGVATSLVWRGAPTHTSAARSEPLPLPRGIDLAAGVSVLVQPQPRYCRKIPREPGPYESPNLILTVANALCPVKAF